MSPQKSLFIGLLLLAGCSSPGTLKTGLVGKWKLDKVYEYQADQSEKHNPIRNRWIEFMADGSFVSDGDPFGRNTGYWSVNLSDSTLFLDSQVDDDDSEWKVILEEDQMTWTGIGHPRKENTRIIHIRESE